MQFEFPPLYRSTRFLFISPNGFSFSHQQVILSCLFKVGFTGYCIAHIAVLLKQTQCFRQRKQTHCFGSGNRPSVLGNETRPSVLCSENRPSVLGNWNRPSIFGNENRPSVFGNENRPGVFGNENRSSVLGKLLEMLKRGRFLRRWLYEKLFGEIDMKKVDSI